MRLVMLGAALALVGCAKPATPEPTSAVLMFEGMPAAGAIKPEVAPMPRRIPDDPRWRARQDSFQRGKELVLRGLARGDIKAGDPVEPLIKRHPRYQVTRAGGFVIMRLEHGEGGTSLVAKGGKLVCAETSSCIYRDVFFDTMTEEERTACWTAYNAALRERIAGPRPPADDAVPPPREVGKRNP